VLGLAMRRTRQAAKKALMDQRLVVGVGNIYANEALYAAGIDPSRRADRLDEAAIERLHAAVVRILTAAIDSEGSTIRDYQTGTGQPGNFQLEFKVYEREGEPCLQCGTLLAGTHAIDARITVFCYRCQGQAGGREGGNGGMIS
jgi:formamidopyrimidine-DNA glycosylase